MPKTDEEIRNDFYCIDCHFDTLDGGEYYMVHNLIWLNAGMELDGGMLCIGCLERRLGFPLTPGCFTDYPVNMPDNGWHKSDRLLERLGYGEQKEVDVS